MRKNSKEEKWMKGGHKESPGNKCRKGVKFRKEAEKSRKG